MKKIEVDKEVFNALNEYLSEYDKELLLRDHCSYSKWENPKFRIFNKISVVDMAEILIKGYEIERTPENKIKNIFENLPNSENDMFFKAGIAFCLNSYGLKIKGIND